MKRGRPRKDQVIEAIKREFDRRPADPCLLEELREQKDSVRRSSNMWREMRRQGISQEYLEWIEITDPSIMGDEVISIEEANQRYAQVLRPVFTPKVRIRDAQMLGAKRIRDRAELRRIKICTDHGDYVRKVADGILSSTRAAELIWPKISEWIHYTGGEKAPSIRTLRSDLRKLAKATQ